MKVESAVCFVVCRLTIFLFAFVAIATISAKPDRPPDSKEPPPKEKIPDVSGESNWGKVTQVDRKLTIYGSETWEAPNGEILPDGRVILRWWNIPQAKPAIGVYRIVGRDLVGHWGWDDVCDIDEHGELIGPRSDETIYKTMND